MNFLGDIVITDPCYIRTTPCPMYTSTRYGDWSCMVYPGSMDTNNNPKIWEEEYIKFFNDYNFAGKSDDEKKALREEHKKFKEDWKKNILGEFCADSGQVGVFEWYKLTESEQKWVLEHPWCAAVIKDFSGNVEFELNGKSLHVVGYKPDGTKVFFTVQSGY